MGNFCSSKCSLSWTPLTSSIRFHYTLKASTLDITDIRVHHYYVLFSPNYDVEMCEGHFFVQNAAFLLALLLSLFCRARPRRLQVISSHLFGRRLPIHSCVCVYFAMSMSVIVLLDQRQSTMWCPRFNILMLIILKYTCLGAYLFQRTDLRFSPIPRLLFLFLKVHDLHTDRSALSKDITSYIIEISRGLTRRWMLSFNTPCSPMDRERKRKCQHVKEKGLSRHTS